MASLAFLPGVSKPVRSDCANHQLEPGFRKIGVAYKEHAIDVVHIAVLPTAMVKSILWHRNLGSVKDRRLVISAPIIHTGQNH